MMFGVPKIHHPWKIQTAPELEDAGYRSMFMLRCDTWRQRFGRKLRIPSFVDLFGYWDPIHFDGPQIFSDGLVKNHHQIEIHKITSSNPNKFRCDLLVLPFKHV